MNVRKHIFFSGRVQGVGFRYRALEFASRLELTGWVRNTWDDRVEMEVQGEDFLISELIDRLQRARYIHIDHVSSYSVEVQKEEKNFIIKH